MHKHLIIAGTILAIVAMFAAVALALIPNADESGQVTMAFLGFVGAIIGGVGFVGKTTQESQEKNTQDSAYVQNAIMNVDENVSSQLIGIRSLVEHNTYRITMLEEKINKAVK